MAKKFVSIELTYENDKYEAILAKDAVPVFKNDKLLATGRWIPRRRRIADLPEEIPSGLVALLSQRLRTAQLSVKVATRVAKKQPKPNPSDVKALFERFQFPPLPPGCRHWTRVHLRQFYTVFVRPDNNAIVFRNAIMVGSARWSPSERILHSYVGDRLPRNVWERLTSQLAAHSNA